MFVRQNLEAALLIFKKFIQIPLKVGLLKVLSTFKREQNRYHRYINFKLTLFTARFISGCSVETESFKCLFFLF